MGIELRSTGNGTTGNLGNVTGYSLSLDATPLSDSGTGGGTPEATITLETGAVIPMTRLMFDEIQLTDTENRGSFYGKVISFEEADDEDASIAVQSPLSGLVGLITMDPYVGTLGDYLSSIISLADEDLPVDIRGDIGSTAIVMPTITGNAWDIIKALGVAFQFETGMLGQSVTIRRPRSASFSYRAITAKRREIVNDRNARNIDITYMNSEWGIGALMYPRAEYRVEESQNIISGQPGSLLTVALSCPGVYATEVVQPIPATPDDDLGVGVSRYYVLDGEGNYVDPSSWVASGGNISLTIAPEGESLTARVRIPDGLANGPYSIAERVTMEGVSTNSLKIYGTGTFTSERTVRFPTGADNDITVGDVGAEVSSPVYMSAAEAYSAALGVAAELSSNVQTLEGSITIPKLEAVSDDWGALTLGDLDLTLGSATFSDYDTELGSMTFEEFNEAINDMALSVFGSQLFGLFIGGRIRYGWSNYRITSTNISETGFDFTADQDVTCSDMEAVYAGLTCGEVGAAYASEALNCREVATLPLYMPAAPGEGLYPADDLYPALDLYPAG